MAGKAINEYGAFTGNPDAVNILVQEKSQGTDHSQAEHKKADLDALLNKKIVQTITDNDTTHVPSADAVYDALLTESTARANADTTLGQNITAEATARQNADTTLGQRINANSKEIANLKQRAGDEIVVNYPDNTYGRNEVPSSVAQYAEVGILKGVGRVANNHVDYTKESHYNASVSISGTQISSTVSVNGGYFGFTGFPVVNGHKYLVVFNVKTKASSSIVLRFLGTNGWIVSEVGRPSQGQNAYLISPSVNDNNGQLYWYGEVGQTDIFDDFVYTDLNVYFGGSIPSNADTIAKIQQNYPELLEPSDHGTEVVFPTYTAVKSVGVNIWDEEWEEGALDSNGNVVASGFSNRRTTSFIRINPETAYFQTSPYGAYGGRIAFYDYNKNFVYYDGNGIPTTGLYTSPQDAYYMRVTLGSSYGTTYGHDIQFCLYSLPSEIRTTYHPYTTDTLTLPESVTLKGAGAVAEEYYPETGRVTHPIGSYTFTGSETWVGWSSDASFCNELQTLIKLASSNGVAYQNMVTDSGLSIVSANTAGVSGGISVTTGGAFLCANSARSSLTGKTIYFELATPAPDTYVDPILDPFIEVEGGGTIEPVQSQSIKIDHAFTAEYLAV